MSNVRLALLQLSCSLAKKKKQSAPDNDGYSLYYPYGNNDGILSNNLNIMSSHFYNASCLSFLLHCCADRNSKRAVSRPPVAWFRSGRCLPSASLLERTNLPIIASSFNCIV